MSKQPRNVEQHGRRTAQHDPLATLKQASVGKEITTEEYDSHVIEQELTGLLQARSYFCDWIDELRREGNPRSATPAQYLRAWNDSTTRVIQLLHARKALRPTNTGFETLFDQVLKELDEEDSRVRH